MKIRVPENVETIIETLMNNGHDAYAVGGCVRDTILEREPGDWDITTSANPMEVKALFRRTIDTGIKHGTVTVMLDKEGYEVTTYRIDGEYEDNRHPKEVEFTKNLVEDLKRRDFTINAMAYNSVKGLVDEFDGIGDIKRKCIRCVGNPIDRFEEDSLRILRAVRFSAQLGFDIEEETCKAIERKAKNLKNISAERIRVELEKLLVSNQPEKLMIAYETGITKIVLPEFDQICTTSQNNPYHIYSVGGHTIESVKAVRGIAILRLTMLLHDIGKPLTKTTDEQNIDHFYRHEDVSASMAKEILKRLKYDNYTIDTVTRLIKWHDTEFRLTPAGMRKAINRVGEDIMELLFEVKEADMNAKNPLMCVDKKKQLEEAKRLYLEVIEKSECVSLKTLALNGKDLIALGYKPGKQIGETLDYLLQKVIEEPTLNEKEKLIELALENKNMKVT
ncbi:CCA tRNA nucleotidyltransferase [Anaeromicropila herbilytica]|uniref:Polynucleotide adenylyltransferase n=1 Tax=Anaeromicropila herbilytica TaxID=2785025 RepID=A0A7R7EHG4_9FIRM|nr:CCA tRNA nucleotidyltransferase [Anaeromicropila herbilytica]BCN28769.1 polynucleotide adenylyltransferase [Anaeromicropila herbilytica]